MILETKQEELVVALSGRRPQGLAQSARARKSHVLAVTPVVDEFSPELALAAQDVNGAIPLKSRRDRLELIDFLQRDESPNGLRFRFPISLVVVEVRV